MVSRILISIALLCSSVAFSQDENGLTFSEVLIVDITNEVVVPDGKVWKLVSVQYSSDYSMSSQRVILINGHVCHLGSFYEGTDFSFPMWLPANTSIEGGASYNGQDFIERINVIEFNTN